MKTKHIVNTIIFTAMLLLFIITPTNQAQADHFADRIRGWIVLDVERNGEAWYIYPKNDHRYYLGRPSDAFDIMRNLGLGITNADLEKIPKPGDSWNAPQDLLGRVQGRIVLQVQANGEAWYVYPQNGRRYFLGRPDDAFNIMRNLGLGITSANLAHIPPTTDPNEPLQDFTRHERKTVATPVGNFDVNVIAIQKSRFVTKTDTAALTDCESNCPAKSLKDFAAENGALIGIHGTYFCPPDYPPCAGKTNSFLPPVYNTDERYMHNAKSLAWHEGPMFSYSADNMFRFYYRTKDFGNTVKEFQDREKTELKAALANYPALMLNGEIVVQHEKIEPSQTTKGTRGGIGFNGQTVFLVVARGASVPDMAHIFKGLGARDAMNLDGGGSAALLFGGEYMVGPGRQLPNAILFRRR
jgi:hypothetical protein